ncbi:amidohydrolase family protein [Inquilinus sp. OTU3971]|uniref:amidohydrolase family protein n=1 Tax=Inquilinus sp. OTU3971 TaxID=3043855 RepID=UPI00313CEB48
MTEPTLWTGPIVDAHQHFWIPEDGHHPWLLPEARIPFRYGDYTPIKRRYLPEDYAADSRGHDIRATVYMEAEWDPADPVGETRWVSDLAARTGRPNAIIAQAWLDRAEWPEVLQAQAGFPLVRSVRHKPGGPARPGEAGRSPMSDDRWRDGYALLESAGLHFDLQAAWWVLPEAEALARDFPRTLIVLNHTGLPADRSEDGLRGWHGAMARLAEWPNVAVKISGLGRPGLPWTTEANGWIVRETVAMFGPDRAMVASNFPVASLCGSFDDIFTGFKRILAPLPPDDQAKLFHGTATAVYRPA